MFKRNWELIDRYAENASSEDAATFDSLLGYFQKFIPDDIDRDVNMVRALTFWMYCYEDRDIPRDLCKEDTPLKLMLDLQNEQKPYASVFATFCTKFGIKCEKVRGISKSGNYQPGDMPAQEEAKTRMSATWNKVFLEGKWWPVYPRWIMKTLTNAPRATSDPAEKRTTTEAAIDRSGFKDFWFLTDPEIFVLKCFPDSIGDQMLPKSKQVPTLKKFFRLPYLTLHFFKENFKLISEESCVIDADNGVGKIQFKSGKIPSKRLAFTHRLSVRERKSSVDITNKFDVNKLVLNSRNKGNFIFEVRCPEVADYTLEIIGGSTSSDEKKVYMVTKVICREKIQADPRLPIDTGAIGWGFGPFARKAGISKADIYAPKVAVVIGRKNKTFDFTIEKESVQGMQYEAELLQGGEENDSVLKDCVETTFDSGTRTLMVRTHVPREGEFALVIKACEKGQTEWKPVCYYLLSTYLDENEVEDDYYDSSDGTSDIDEEIEELRHKVEEMKRRRDQLLSARAGSRGTKTAA